MSVSAIRKTESYLIYLSAVSAVGLVVLVWALLQLPGFSDPLILALLLLLAIVAQFATTSHSTSSAPSITYAIAPAVSLAALPLWGTAAAVLIDAGTAIGLWLIKPAEGESWKRSWQQLAFNTSIGVVATFVAGMAFEFMHVGLGPETVLGRTIPWLVAAVVLDQTNLFLLLGIIRLKQGPQFDTLEMWRKDSWASRISIGLMAAGGGLLAYAVEAYDWIAILIFFLPILLSAYAFHLYVRQMQAHMENLEHIVDERTQELKTLMKEKDAFLAVLTHDMKTPLTSIGLYASLLRDHPHLVQKKPKMVDVIHQSQEQLVRIVNDILDLEKLNSDGTFALEKENIDLVNLLESTVDSVILQAMQKEIALEFKPLSPSIVAGVDRQQIERVLQNLLSNGIKYTPKGGSVCAQIDRDGDFALIEIADNGYGIPAEDLPFIFDRFRRVAKHKKAAIGTGLGLAIAKALVEAHEGAISVTSEEEKGSRFVVKLPCSTPPPHEPAA